MNLGNLDFDIVSNFVLLISYFSYRDTNFSSTFVESALQIAHFMQNKPNLRKAQMNVTNLLTTNYEQLTMNYVQKNKPKTNPIQSQSNPIKANKMPKQTRFKPKQTQPVVSLPALPALPALSAAEGSVVEGSNLFQRQKNSGTDEHVTMRTDEQITRRKEKQMTSGTDEHVTRRKDKHVTRRKEKGEVCGKIENCELVRDDTRNSKHRQQQRYRNCSDNSAENYYHKRFYKGRNAPDGGL